MTDEQYEEVIHLYHEWRAINQKILEHVVRTCNPVWTYVDPDLEMDEGL